MSKISDFRQQIRDRALLLSHLEAQRARLLEQRSRAERQGDSGRTRVVEAQIKTLKERIAEIRDDQSGDRASLQGAVLEVLGAQDPESDFSLLDAGFPVLLMPVRLETRFSEAEQELLIRVFPDDIHVDSHEPELTDQEVAAGERYHARLAEAEQLEEDEREAAELAAWSELVSELGEGRAPWVRRVLSHTPASEIPRRADTWTRAPRSEVLPDRWLALGYRNGQRQFTHAGRLIPDQLEVGPTPEEDATPDPGQLAIQPGLRWLVDFDEAVRVGMGLRVPFEADPEMASKGLDQLLVVGVKSSLTPTEGSESLARLLDAHHFTGGLSLLSQGTPSNNTAEERSAYQAPAEDSSQSLPLETSGSLFSRGNGSNGDRLADAFGLDQRLGERCLGHLQNAQLHEYRDAGMMNTVFWPITWGYYLTQMMRPETGGHDEASQTTIEAARGHFLRYVRARGPLPALRVADQPYGILPVTSLDRWEPADKSETGFESRLATLLTHLREVWRTSLAGVPHPGSTDDPIGEMVATLRLEAVSRRYEVRSVHGPQFQRNLIEMLASPNGRQASLYQEMFDQKRAQAEAVLRGLGVQARSPLLAACLLGLCDYRLSRNLVQLPLRAGDDLNPNYIQWLLESNLQQVREEEFPDEFDQPVPLLYLLLRHAVLAEYADSGWLILQRLRLTTTTLIEPELVDIVSDTISPTAWKTLNTTIETDDLPNQSVATLLDAKREERMPLIPPKFGDFWNALRHLNRLTARDLELLMRETLDLAAHRLDAWITSLATRRLDTIRKRDGFNLGVHIGGFGYVEELRPQQSPASEGYIHAPSLAQAASAAVLYNGYLTHRDSALGQPLEINLESRRVDLALQLLDGIRQGQPLGALLGYRFERGLHESHPGVELDEFIFPLRVAFPLEQPPAEPADEGDAEGQPGVVVDGLRLHRIWQAGAESADDDTAARAQAGYEAVAAALEQQQPGALPSDFQDERAQAISAELEILDDAIDALSDLLMAESVHQLVEGNPERAAAVTSSVAGSETRPPRPESVRTPRTGISLTHRVMLAFNQQPQRSAGWNDQRPRARAAPFLDAWVSRLLGDAGQINLEVTFSPLPDAPPLNVPGVKVSMAALGLAALDMVYLAEGDTSGASSELAQRALLHVSGNLPGGVAQLSQIQVATERGALWPTTEFAYSDIFDLLSSIRGLLGASRGLRMADLSTPEREIPPTADVQDLQTRAERAVVDLVAAGEQLRDLFATPTDAASRSAITDLLDLNEPLPDNLLDLPDSVEPANLARQPGGETFDVTALQNLALLREKIARFSEFGISGSMPVSLLSTEPEDRAALWEQATSLDQEAARRITAGEDALNRAAATSDAESVLEALGAAIRAVFGESFPVLASLTPGNEFSAELDQIFHHSHSEILLDGHSAAPEEWLRSISPLRDRPRQLEDALFYGEVLHGQKEGTLQVGQLPFRQQDRWAALPLIPGERLEEDRFSLLIYAPTRLSPVGQNGIRGLFVDQWSELLPNPTELTGLSLHFDGPGARPPQVMLLAVPPKAERDSDWSLIQLEEIILETMELSKLRTVDLESLRGLGQFLPAVHLAANPDEETASIDLRRATPAPKP